MAEKTETKESKKPEGGAPPDILGEMKSILENHKSEMGRKVGNLTEGLQNLQERNSSLEALLSRGNKEPEQKPGSYRDDFYEDEERTFQRLKADAVKEAEASISEKFEKRVKADEARGLALNQLTAEFPEVMDQKSELFKKAEELHGKLSEGLKGTGDGYKIAVREAAALLNVLPKSNRKPEDNPDDFTMGGGSRRSQKRHENNADISPETDAFARMVGLDMDDEETKERIQKRQNRNYQKWS